MSGGACLRTNVAIRTGLPPKWTWSSRVLRSPKLCIQRPSPFSYAESAGISNFMQLCLVSWVTGWKSANLSAGMVERQYQLNHGWNGPICTLNTATPGEVLSYMGTNMAGGSKEAVARLLTHVRHGSRIHSYCPFPRNKAGQNQDTSANPACNSPSRGPSTVCNVSNTPYQL